MSIRSFQSFCFSLNQTHVRKQFKRGKRICCCYCQLIILAPPHWLCFSAESSWKVKEQDRKSWGWYERLRRRSEDWSPSVRVTLCHLEEQGEDLQEKLSHSCLWPDCCTTRPWPVFSRLNCHMRGKSTWTVGCKEQICR